jgi:hypothetical protein
VNILIIGVLSSYSCMSRDRVTALCAPPESSGGMSDRSGQASGHARLRRGPTPGGPWPTACTHSYHSRLLHIPVSDVHRGFLRSRNCERILFERAVLHELQTSLSALGSVGSSSPPSNRGSTWFNTWSIFVRSR